MKLTHLPSEFQKALPILKKIRSAGYEAYFVGGSVRDALLNRPIHDVDIATSSYPEETKRIFKRTVDIGIEHGTVLVLEEDGEYEITTFRTEDVYVDYRRPSQVNFVRSLDEDLKRRDFTVNAFALAPDGEIVDHFGGLDDLEHKILRAVGEPKERFNEDALRILRGLRFLASLDFTLEEKTFAAMKSHAHLLEKISIERSFIELDKLLVAPFWKKGLRAFVDCEAYRYLPQLDDQAPALLAMTEEMTDTVFVSSTQAWAALLLEMKCQNPRGFLKAWKTSSQFQKEVTAIMAIYELRLEQPVDRRILYHYGRDLVCLAERLREAKGLAVDYESIDAIYKDLPIYDKHEIVVNGADLIKQLGLTPGPSLGEHLSAVELAIVDGDLANDRSAILEFARRRQDE
ncbi:CCA tRNA nucleotidyltransferase [Streptococcus hyointestinalis]|uniref:CCA tRNA nucleotidyltransferase n=1 Tax=Streptococcus hyointestinalis TaxID=1337 RepID=UPI0013DF99BA|nr:CCA tRNA nucleotidyltransferase [Streptococcus hyointestinalis]